MKVILSIILCIFCSSSLAGGQDESNIPKHHAALSKSFNENIISKNYEKAYLVALEQLKLDPSDTAAYLRLAIATQHLNIDSKKILNDYSSEVSEADSFHVEIKSIADSILKSSNMKGVSNN